MKCHPVVLQISRRQPGPEPTESPKLRRAMPATDELSIGAGFAQPNSIPREFNSHIRSGRSSGFRILRPPKPSRSTELFGSKQWYVVMVVPDYSGGTATDLHRLPYSPNPSPDSAPKPRRTINTWSAKSTAQERFGRDAGRSYRTLVPAVSRTRLGHDDRRKCLPILPRRFQLLLIVADRS